MIKERMSALLMSVLMLACSFTVTAADNGTTSCCEDGNLVFVGHDVEYEYANASTHYRKVYCVLYCQNCGSMPRILEYKNTESHSGSAIDLVEQHHEGVYHYYTYRYRCSDCGGYYTVTEPPEYCGNPCRGIHLSIPNEDF